MTGKRPDAVLDARVPRSGVELHQLLWEITRLASGSGVDFPGALAAAASLMNRIVLASDLGQTLTVDEILDLEMTALRGGIELIRRKDS